MTKLDRTAVMHSMRQVIPANRRVGLHEPDLTGREFDYLKDCIDEGWVSYLGRFVDKFEIELARISEVRHAVAIVNGTAALHAALLIVGVRPGDEVLVPALTFAATANAVRHCFAVPHFVDSEVSTLGLDPDELDAYLTENTDLQDGICMNRNTGRAIRAVVPVHIFGHPVRMSELQAVSQKWNLVIVEDAAEALGSRMNGRPVGGDGLMSVLSFNGNKIVTTGGGGAILTNDSEIAARAKHLTTTAKKPHPYLFFHDEVGYNYRLPNINAALGCAQLERLAMFLAQKRRLADHYARAFNGVPGVQFFREPEGATSNYWLNSILLDRDYAGERDFLIEELNSEGLGCRPVWTPLHQLPMYATCPRMDLAVCEEIAARLISLPSSPALAPQLEEV
jgi:perosamine synthetase